MLRLLEWRERRHQISYLSVSQVMRLILILPTVAASTSLYSSNFMLLHIRPDNYTCQHLTTKLFN